MKIKLRNLARTIPITGKVRLCIWDIVYEDEFAVEYIENVENLWEEICNLPIYVSCLDHNVVNIFSSPDGYMHIEVER